MISRSRLWTSNGEASCNTHGPACGICLSIKIGTTTRREDENFVFLDVALSETREWMEKILSCRVCFTRAGAGALEPRVEGRVGRKEESRREGERNSVFFRTFSSVSINSDADPDLNLDPKLASPKMSSIQALCSSSMPASPNASILFALHICIPEDDKCAPRYYLIPSLVEDRRLITKTSDVKADEPTTASGTQSPTRPKIGAMRCGHDFGTPLMGTNTSCIHHNPFTVAIVVRPHQPFLQARQSSSAPVHSSGINPSSENPCLSSAGGL